MEWQNEPKIDKQTNTHINKKTDRQTVKQGERLVKSPNLQKHETITRSYHQMWRPNVTVVVFTTQS